MILNDPPITLKVVGQKERNGLEGFLQKFEFWQFKKSDYYCIDGFPTEGMPGVVIIPPPFRGNYVYQGLKPAVIVLSEDNLEDSDLFEEVKKQEVLDHIEKKQLELNEKLKAKRDLSAMPAEKVKNTLG